MTLCLNAWVGESVSRVTFVQDVPQCDPLPGDGDVLDLGLGLHQGHAAEVVLLDAQRGVACTHTHTHTLGVITSLHTR